MSSDPTQTDSGTGPTPTAGNGQEPPAAAPVVPPAPTVVADAPAPVAPRPPRRSLRQRVAALRAQGWLMTLSWVAVGVVAVTTAITRAIFILQQHSPKSYI